VYFLQLNFQQPWPSYLNRLQGDTDMQHEMVKLVNYFDQNGVGTDLQVRQRNQSGLCFC